jgi:plasmid stabilization system protein ParE
MPKPSGGFVIASSARTDLAEIAAYLTEHAGAVISRSFVNELYRVFAVLALLPSMGSRRPELSDKPVRFWPHHPYLIVYAADERPVQILRVLHGARDVSGMLAA